MPNETKPDQLPETENETINPLDIFTDLVSTLTLPAHVIRNASKAVGRLCSAVIDVPAGALERRSAEKQAESEARIQIIEENAAQITRQMNVSAEYAQRAGNKFAGKIIREQINLDKISAAAINELQQSESDGSTNQSADNEEEKTISDDWLNSFEEEARQKSTEDMQLRFGRILAGEIRRPGSYSIRAVKILGELDQNAATLFKKLCSVSVVLGHLPIKYIRDARVCFLDEKPGKETLVKYGLGMDQLDILEEYNLIRPNYYYSTFRYDICIVNHNNHQVPVPFHHQGKNWVLVPLSERAKNQDLSLSGIAFSQISCELFYVVDQDPMGEYTEDLKKFFAEQNLRMVEVPIQNQDTQAS